MSFDDENISLISDIEDLAGIEDIEEIEAAKKKAKVKKKVKAKTKKQRTAYTQARLKGKAIAKAEKARRAKGECGTYDIGCKIQKSIGAIGKGLLILGAVLGVAWIGKSYLEKRGR